MTAAIHSERCLRNDRPSVPSLSSCSFAHGDSRTRCSDIAQVELEPGTLQLHLGIEHAGTIKRRCHWADSVVVRAVARVCGLARQAARQYLEVLLEAVEEPVQRADLVPGHHAVQRLISAHTAREHERRDHRRQHRHTQVRSGSAIASSTMPPQIAMNTAAAASSLSCSRPIRRWLSACADDAGRLQARFEHAQQMQRHLARRVRCSGSAPLRAVRLPAGCRPALPSFATQRLRQQEGDHAA